MRAAIIENGIVVNIAEADEAFAQSQGWIITDDAQIGWSYADGVFTAPPPQPEPVPASASPLQIRKALRQMGLKASIDAYIATQDDETQESWEYAVQIDRDNPLIAAAADELEKTEAEIDDLFRLAATL